MYKKKMDHNMSSAMINFAKHKPMEHLQAIEEAIAKLDFAILQLYNLQV
jgi:hypothetical protein